MLSLDAQASANGRRNFKSVPVRQFVVFMVLMAATVLLTVMSAAAAPSKIGWQFSYDEKGRTTSITDPGGKRTGIRYEDDANGRLRTVTQELPGGRKVAHLFDGRGRRARMVDGAGSVEFTYDRSDRPSAVRRAGAPAIAYGYDTQGRIKSVDIGSRFVVGYEYDFRGRLEKITTPAGSVLYRYFGDSASVVRRLPNGVTTRWSYRPDGRLESITHTAPDNKPLGQLRYTYRLDGLIRTIQESTLAGSRERRYGYDSTKRLISVSGHNQSRTTYAYDKLGNRTELRQEGGNQVKSEYDWAGRLVSHDGRPCRHDPAGNLVSCDGKTPTFTYSETGLVQTASLAAGTIRYSHDGDGYLVGRNNASEQVNFLPDPLADIWRPLLITHPHNNKETFYVWDGASPLMSITNSEVRYYLHDHLGSVRMIADRRGEIIERRDYLPFGEASQNLRGADLQPGFAGLFFDGTASLYLTRARIYDPTLGRFLQPDPQHRVPKGSQKDLSLYAYCGGDPINYLDLNGFASVPFIDLFIKTGDLLLNTLGTGSNWIGRNRSGAHMSFVRDAEGQFPLGDTSIAGKNAFDKYARLHDIEYWVSTHFRKGTEVKVPAPGGGYEYFTSGGSSGIDAVNQRVVGKSIVGWVQSRLPLPLTNNLFTEGRKTATTNNPIELKFDVMKGTMTRAPSSPHTNLESDRANSLWPQGLEKGRLSATTSSGFQPGKVGGIRLAGAGSSLSQLGELEGVALDETNGRLVLIGKGKRPINLPPLRLDDVVTIFRSVYLHGEAPSVSIDPVSDKKTEKLMTVRHGAATANTYVGWVLYEADRTMKTYQFGKDNRTKAGFFSLVPGYRNLYGQSRGTPKMIWERFWIVPASVNGMQDAKARLTTFEVPLQVNTERMEWLGGKFATARNPTPSYSAKQFQEWFTKNYDRVAEEALLQPPPQCGVESRVAVFQELKRMALITAIAETMRTQNVPFPAWMRDYPVRSCPVDETTPILRDVERGAYVLTGGVQLGVPDRNLRILNGDVKHQQLARTVQSNVATKPLLSATAFDQEDIARQAVIVPGVDSQRSGANVLRHTDLVLPLSDGVEISLTRHFNSFFDAHGPFGRGWTLDLPQLERQRVPISRDGKEIKYRLAYELTSPLNTWSARFAEVRFTPEVNGPLMVPAAPGEMLGLTDSNHRLIGKKTKMLIFRNGRRWYFDEHGYLVGQSDPSLMVVYQRDPLHRIHMIKAWRLQNGQAVTVRTGGADAQMRLDYLGLHVKTIEASSSSSKTLIKAHYVYDQGPQLAMVLSSSARWQYTYGDGLVASVTEDDQDKISFAYSSDGQLQSEARAGGQTVLYETIATPQGTSVVARTADTQKVVAGIVYDANFQATSRTFDDGSAITWNNTGKTLDAVITEPHGDRHTISDSSDGRRRTIKTAAGATHHVDLDEAGRVTKINFEGGPTVEQKWQTSGRLQSTVSDTEAILPGYGKDGALSSVVVTTPDGARSGRFNRHVTVNLDRKERISSVEDDSGGRLEITYDKSGRPSTIRSPNGTIAAQYNSKAQITRVDTTWGAREIYEYDVNSGDLSRVTMEQQRGGEPTERAALQIVDGRLVRVQDHDAGETRLDYYETGSTKGLVRRILTPNKVVLRYGYDLRKRLTSIQIGDEQGDAYHVRYHYDSRGRLTEISYEGIQR